MNHKTHVIAFYLQNIGKLVNPIAQQTIQISGSSLGELISIGHELDKSICHTCIDK